MNMFVKDLQNVDNYLRDPTEENSIEKRWPNLVPVSYRIMISFILFFVNNL